MKVGRVSRPARAAGRVGPVQRRVDRQQVRQVVAVGIHQLVDPLDADGPLPLRLDRERRRVVEQQASLAGGRDRAVAPDGRRRASRPAGSAARTAASRSRSSRRSCRPCSMIVPARGMTGGMSSGVWYFGIAVGSSEPPGICAIAFAMPVSVLKPNSVSVVPPAVYLRNVRRVIMIRILPFVQTKSKHVSIAPRFVAGKTWFREARSGSGPCQCATRQAAGRRP